MQKDLIYKSYPTWILPFFISLFFLIPAPFLDLLHPSLLYIYPILVISSLYFFLLKIFYFYNNRVEIHYLLRRKKITIYFIEIKKIQIRNNEGTRSPPQIIIITKDEPTKFNKSLPMFDDLAMRDLLHELHNLGLEIELSSNKEYNRKIKNW